MLRLSSLGIDSVSLNRSPEFIMTTADRNLLFGILALQMNFVTRNALIAAMNAWVLDKQKSLGQILVEHGAVTAARRAPSGTPGGRTPEADRRGPRGAACPS